MSKQRPEKTILPILKKSPETEAEFIEICEACRKWLMIYDSDSKPNLFIGYYFTQIGLDSELLKEAISKYPSVKRLFEEIKRTEKWTVLDQGVKGNLKSDVVKLFLVNEHNYKDTKQPASPAQKKKDAQPVQTEEELENDIKRLEKKMQ